MVDLDIEYVWSEGMKHVLRDKEKCDELYFQIQSEIMKYMDYLKEKREHDPYRNLLPRLLYQTTHGFTSEVPAFEIWPQKLVAGIDFSLINLGQAGCKCSIGWSMITFLKRVGYISFNS